MREIFQHASDGMATPLSPSANLSVVCMHTGVLAVLCLLSFEYLMVFLRWVGLWGGKKWCSWPPGCCSQSSSNWSDWGSCWEGEWLTPFLPQVGLSVSVIFQMCPSWDSNTTVYDFPRHGNPEQPLLPVSSTRLSLICLFNVKRSSRQSVIVWMPCSRERCIELVNCKLSHPKSLHWFFPAFGESQSSTRECKRSPNHCLKEWSKGLMKAFHNSASSEWRDESSLPNGMCVHFVLKATHH